MFNYFDNREACGKGAQSIKCVSFISATFVPNDSRFDKYLASYARGPSCKEFFVVADFS